MHTAPPAPDKNAAAGEEPAAAAGHAAAMAGSLAWLYLVAALLAPITILAPHHPGTDAAGVAILGTAAAAVGLGLRLRAEAIPAWGSELLLVLGTVMTGAAIHVTDGVPNAASLLFLWVALYGFYFLPRRRALLQVLLIGACYAAVIAVRPPPFPAVAHWATTVVSVLVAGLIVGALKQRVDRLVERLRERADAFARSERETRLIVDTAQHAYVAFDETGRVLEWNTAAEATFGWTRAQAVGQPVDSLIVPGPRRAAFGEALAAFAAGRGSVPPGSREAVAVARGGLELPVEVSLSVLPRAGGAVISAFVSDISERRRLEEDRLRERRFLDTVLESVDTGIVACDAGGRVALLNRAARGLLGLAPGSRPAAGWSGEEHLLRALGGEPVEDEELTVVSGDGDRRRVVCHARPTAEDSGRRLGAVLALTDITARKQAEAALLNRESQLNEAQALAHVGSWEWDTSRNSLEWSAEQCRIFGVRRAPASEDAFLALVHRDDRASLVTAIRRVRPGDKLALSHRIVRPDGAVREVSVRGELIERGDGAGRVLFGTCQDVTERRRAERAMARHTAGLRRMAELSRSLAWVRETRDVACLACDAALELTGAAAATFWAVNRDGSRTALARAGDPIGSGPAGKGELHSIPSAAQPRAQLELRHAADGQTGDQPGELIQLLAADVGSALERVELLARLEEAARRDELTGLPNRRLWEEQLPREIARARRERRQLAIVLLDLDRFKRYNDEHGHQAGDRLLARSALQWVSQLRPTDLLARYGGEEFGLLLPDCGAEKAIDIVERLRRATPSGQTCSAGIAVWDFREGADAVVARADAALYSAKTSGRDRSCLAA